MTNDNEPQVELGSPCVMGDCPYHADTFAQLNEHAKTVHEMDGARYEDDGEVVFFVHIEGGPDAEAEEEDAPLADEGEGREADLEEEVEAEEEEEVLAKARNVPFFKKVADVEAEVILLSKKLEKLDGVLGLTLERLEKALYELDNFRKWRAECDPTVLRGEVNAVRNRLNEFMTARAR